MLKRMFVSPFFAVLLFIALFSGFVCGVYHYNATNLLGATADGAIIDVIAKFGYVLLIATLLVVSTDFKDKTCTWGIYLFLTICCFLRESGIQHHLSASDTTPFKSRFFLNPHNPMYEKVIFGAILLVIFGALAYLAIKYSRHLIISFFKLDTITWTVAVLCTNGVMAKVIDRYPSNYRKAHGDVPLPQDIYVWLQVLEETGEMFLPYLAMLALWQYHLIKNK